MTELEIRIAAARLIAEQLGANPEAVKSDTKLVSDLGADSLDIIEMVMALEEEFDIQVTDEETERLSTVADVLALIAKHVALKPAA